MPWRSGRRRERPRNAARALVGALLLVAPLAMLWAPAARGWPGLRAYAQGKGILIELDRHSYELTAWDLRDGAAGPRFLVATGSPRHPTPPGDYRMRRLIRNPGWRPGAVARARGATPEEPSPDGPMGIAKLPFGGGGLALHGGARPLLLGKPITLGCLRARDADLLQLIDWLETRGALGETSATRDGELHRPLRVPLRIRIH